MLRSNLQDMAISTLLVPRTVAHLGARRDNDLTASSKSSFKPWQIQKSGVSRVLAARTLMQHELDGRAATATARGQSCGRSARGVALASRINDDAGTRLDPDQMILNGFHTGDILGRDLQRLPLPLIQNRAPELNDAIVHDDVDRAERRPLLLLEMLEQLIANNRVAPRRFRGRAHHADHSMHQV